MKKRAISASVTLLLICFHAGAQTPPQGILECAGPDEFKGINAPKDSAVISKTNEVAGTYTFQGNVLIESAGGTGKDQRFNLCSTTSTNAVYSTDCATSTASYTAEWLRVSDSPSLNAFQARHVNSWVQLDTVVVDRVNLTLDDWSLSTQERSDYVPSKNALDVKPYLLSSHFVATCHLARTQF